MQSVLKTVSKTWKIEAVFYRFLVFLNIVGITVLSNNFVVAQSNGNLIEKIRSNYNEIKKNQESFDTTVVPIWGESVEGGEAIGYFDQEKLKLIKIVWLGETGRQQIEFYFSEGALNFAFVQKWTYNRPIYWDENKMIENGDDEMFDLEKSIINEDRYYFEKGELFLWLGNDREEVNLGIEINSLVGEELIARCNELKENFVK